MEWLHGEWAQWLVPGLGFALEISVLVFLLRWRTWRVFPVYSAYIVFVLLRAFLLFATLSQPQSYYLVYWVTAPLEIVITVLAALESFWRVLRSFRLLRWFRWVLPLGILAALAYAAWQGYRFPPVEASRAGAAIINATVASHYVVLTIAIVFFGLVALLHTPWRIHEHRFLLGFGIASLAVAFGGSVRAVFGSSFAGASRHAEPIGYLLALLIWLSAAIHPLPESRTAANPPVEILSGLKFQLRNLRSFVRKGAR